MKNYLKRFLVLCLALTMSFSFTACTNTNDYNQDLENESLIESEEDDDLDKSNVSLSTRIDTVCENMIENIEEDSIFYVSSEIVKSMLKNCKYPKGFNKNNDITDDDIEELIRRNADKLDKAYGEFDSDEFTGREKIYFLYENYHQYSRGNFVLFIEPFTYVTDRTAKLYYYDELDEYEDILYDLSWDLFRYKIYFIDETTPNPYREVFTHEDQVVEAIRP